jgi:O-antigen/teichoic acid export membrane protein
MDSLNAYDAILQGLRHFKTSSRNVIVSQIAVTVAIFTAIIVTRSAIWIVLAYFLSWTLMRVIFTIVTVRKESIGPGAPEDERYVSRGKHLSFIEIAKTVSGQIDQILLFHYLGAANLATYSLALAAPNQIKAMTKQISTLAAPKIAERSPEEMKRMLRKKMLVLGAGILAVVATYILAAPLLFKLFFPKYMESVFYSQIFSISLLGTVSVLSTATLQLKATVRQLHTLNLTSSALEIGTIVIAASYFGIIGVVIARVLNRFIYLGLSLWMVEKI